jgi:Spy/CpxP family protein refolding chaperone
MKRQAICALMTFAAASALCRAQPPVDAVKAYLGLTDSQINSLTTIRQQQMSSAQTIQQAIAAKTKALQDALNSGTTDATTLGTQLLDIAAQRKKLDQLQTSAQAQAASALTAVQQAKLATLVDASKLREDVQQAGVLGLIVLPPGPPPAGPGGPPEFAGPPPGPNPMGRPARRN